MKNRLQFIHHNEVFPSRESAIKYVKDLQIDSRPSLFAEPIVLKYESGDPDKGPNIIVAIGSHGIGKYDEGEYKRTLNKTFFIDVTSEQEKIEDLYEKLAEAIESLTLIPFESDTIKAYADKTENGTIISGDVKTAESRIFSGVEKTNTIQVVEGEGLYHYVDVVYTENGTLKFQVNDVIKDYSVPTVVSGEYVYNGDNAENIILTLNDGSTIKIPVNKLINEWTVAPEDATNTPIVLKRDRAIGEDLPHGVESWQDLLSADIRLHEGDGNIIYKTDANKTLYATVGLDYNEIENKLIFKWSENGQIKTKDIPLNSVKVIEYIKYDPTTEEIVIGYKVSVETIEVRIPVGDLINEWTVVDAGHNVILNKVRSVSGTDIVYGDVRIASQDIAQNNIIETVGDNHSIYVRGEADNIKFGDSDVDTELKRLDNEDVRIESKLDAEIARAEAAETVLTDKIGSGFTTDIHQNITYKFNQLSGAIDSNISGLTAEIIRAKAAEADLQGQITDEVTARGNADAALADDIAVEVSRSKSAEGVLSDKIGSGFTTNPYENITAKFNTLNSTLNDTIANLNTEISNREDADEELTTAINHEVTRAQETEADLQSQITAEATARGNADATLQGNITAEETRATGAETVLTDKIGSGFTTNPYENITYKFGQHSTAIANTESGLTHEINRAEAAEGELQNQVTLLRGDITAEETRAKGAETVLTDKIGSGFTNDPHDNITYKFNNLENKVVTIDTVVSGNTHDITTLSNKVTTLSAETASKVDSVTAKDTSVVVDNTDANNPEVGINLRSSSANILTIDGGVYATVDLTYDELANKLTFTTTNGSKEISLLSESIVKSIIYNPITKTIDITYTVNGVEYTTVVPVQGLIEEWEPNNDGHTVRITRVSVEGDKDQVSADLKISNDPDNILVVDSNEYLKVSNSSIVAVGERLDGEIARAKAAESGINQTIVVITGNVSTISGSVSDANANIASLSGDVATISGNVATISGNVATISGTVDNMMSHLNVSDPQDVNNHSVLLTKETEGEDTKIRADVRLRGNGEGFTNLLKQSGSDGTLYVSQDDIEINLHQSNNALYTVDNKVGLNVGNVVEEINSDNNVKFQISEDSNGVKTVKCDVELFECGDY